MKKLNGVFPQDDYIVDLAIELSADIKPENCLRPMALDASMEKIWAVEVNPFYETTDACLFSWNKDASSILMNTEKTNTAMRIRTLPAKGATSLVYGIWKDILVRA
mmetsp:Transcript_17651/g.21441  ORF Transcript_17651/g.21441 Transcript_17651/m.21441 type:complete len:106 (-) Transcript_17651:204-521(-)